MAEVSGLDMVREIIGQINNLRRLVTINGKKYKWDGKKYVRAVDGKTFTKKELTSFVKNQKFTAPEVPKKEKPKTKLQVKTTPKAKQNPLKVGKEKLNTFTQNRMNERWLNNRTKGNTNNQVKVGKDGMTRGTRATVNNMMQQRGPAAGVVLPVLNALVGETGFDVGGRIANILTNAVTGGPDFNLQERKAFNAQQMANRELKIQQNKATKEAQRLNKNYLLMNPNSEQTGGAIGRSRQDPYLNRPDPTPTPKKEKPKEEVKVNKKKKSTVGKVMGDYAGSYNETKTKKNTEKKKEALKVNKQLERRKKAIKRAYGNISEKRLKQLLSRAVTQLELEES